MNHSAHSQENPDPKKLLQTIAAFIRAETWLKSRRIVEEHPELLSDEADALLGQLAQSQDNDNARRTVEQHRSLLRRCREAGIAAAFADKPGGAELPIPEALRPLFQQAQAGTRHYLQTKDLAVLDTVAAAWRQVWAHPDFAGTPAAFRLVALNDGAGIFLSRYWAQGELQDLTIALSQWETCVALTPADYPYLARYLNNLGKGLSARYARTGVLADLARAIQVYEQAVQQTPAGSPEHAALLNSLGKGLSTRYARTGVLADLTRAIQVWEQAVQETPAGSPDLPGYLNNLGAGLRDRYARTGELADLTRAIQVWEQAVQETPAGSSDLPGGLSNLGLGLRDRYTHMGTLADLTRAIQVWEQAVQQTPAGSPDLPRRLNNLGLGLRDRYTRTGVLADLTRAIQVYEQAVQQTPAGSPDLPALLNNLGNGLRTRYVRMGALADLERAIEVYEQAVQQTPAGSPDLPGELNNLGNGLRTRYVRMGALADLERAIEMYEQAVQQTPASSPDLPSYFNNLGTGLSDRYARTGVLADLDRAIQVWEQAVQQTPASSPDLPSYFNNLGTGLSDRYARTGVLADLDRAIERYEQAVQQTPTGSPDLPGSLNNLGKGFRDRYARTGEPVDLERACTRYRDACQQGLGIASQSVMVAGCNWSRWAFKRQAWAEVGEAVGYAFKAMDRLVATQFRREEKATWLKEFQGLSALGAYAYAKFGQLDKAVETLEHGRAQLLRESLERNRRDLARLRELGHGELYDLYRDLMERREALILQMAAAAQRKLPGVDAQAIRQDLVAVDEEWDEAVAAIRRVRGYEQFLLPPTFADIQAAAQDAPLVYLMATSAGGLALVVGAAGNISASWLDDLTEDTLRKQVNTYLETYFHRNEDATAWFAALGDITHWLWEAALGPVMENLTSNPSPGRRGKRAAVFIPTGLLSLLPLHAAWTEDATIPTGRRYLLDDLRSSYAPSAQALAAARHTAQAVRAENLFAVDNPDGSLRFSQQEVAAVRQWFKKPFVARHNQATLNTVQAALPEAQVWHFSTHGSNGWNDPLESSLLCYGDLRLTLRELFSWPPMQARLAFLSACETGIPDLRILPDEVVGLAAGFLQAGAAGVVSTLWSVNDQSTSLLAGEFYRLWRDEGLPPAEALRQAQVWLRDERGYQQPFYWAAFTFNGV